MSLQYSKPGHVFYNSLQNVNDLGIFETRVPSQTDNANSFFNRFGKITHGYLYQNIQTGDTKLSPATPIYIGPTNEVDFQIISSSGGNGTSVINIYGSLDGQVFNSLGITAGSSDKIYRVSSKYRYLRVDVTTIVAGDSIYIMCS
jgi:hypothetical protein